MSDAPEGTWWVGGPVDCYRVSLRVCGETLDPDEVTAVLGAAPTRSSRKGDVVHSVDGRHSRTVKRGVWSYQDEATGVDVGDLETAAIALLSMLTSDLSVWNNLSQRFEIDLFCGLFLEAPNRGLSLSANLLRQLGDRGIELGLDIYSPDFDQALESFTKGPPDQR